MSYITNLKETLEQTLYEGRQRWETFQQDNPVVMARAKIAGRIAKWLGIAGLVSVIVLFLLVRFGAFGALPSYPTLRKIQNPIASEVYSADGILLGRYFQQNRTNIAYNAIPKHLIDALVATEDARFYEHNGVDFWSLFRVFFKSILFQNSRSGGGSTISQQLVKNLYGRKNYSILTMPVNKIREMIIASRLENIYDKKEILELYLNTVSFGEDVYGIETASKRYFNKKPKDLKIEDAAVLVGMLKATTYYNPKKNPEYALGRRNIVFDQMKNEEVLSAKIADSLRTLPLKIDYKFVGQSDGLAPHLRERMRGELEKWCATKTRADGSPYNLYTDGLKIYTTINSKMQQYAQEAVQEHLSTLQQTFFDHWKNRKPWGKDDKQIQLAKKQSLRYQKLKALGLSEVEIDKNFKTPILMRVFTHKGGVVEKEMSPLDSIAYYQMFLNTGFVVTEPKTGYIRAYIGSINHKYFQYDHVRAKRQVGSTFKPIVYATAIENGHRPCDYVPNHLVTFTEYNNWKPENSDGKYGGFYSLEGGLKGSVNTVSVDLTLFSGVEKVIDFAHKMGIESEIPNVPSIALGAADIPLYEMMKVYGTIANYGKRVEPNYLLRVEDKRGNVLKTWQAETVAFDTEEKPFMSEGTAETMIEMMQTVVDSGTARRLRYRYGLTMPIAGKTGTTQNQADGWFMGFTSNLVGGVWVGGANRHIRFRNLANGQGANMALPIWGIFMQKVVKNKVFNHVKQSFFRSPADSVQLMLDCPYYVDEIWPTDIEEYLSPEELEERLRINERPDEDLSDMELQREEELDAKVDKKRKKAKRKARKKKKRKEFWNKVKGIFKKD